LSALPVKDVGGILAVGAAYYGAAKLGQALRYTASVSAIWPPAGLGIAVLYVRGLALWPGIFIGELLVNGELLGGATPLPFGSLAGQQLGNVAEVIIGAWLLCRLIGPGARLDQGSQVVLLTVAIGAATAVSAGVGTVSMVAGGIVGYAEAPTFARTWWLGDTAGALIVVPLVLTWLGDPKAAVRRMWRVEGVLMIATVAALAASVVTRDSALLYLTFPALAWAAFRFGPPGVTLASLLVAGITIGITAHRHGAFYEQAIDSRALHTQLYAVVGTLTALFLSAAVSERERTAAELGDARRREIDRVLEDRRRMARDLHDSLSQALFSSMLHTARAEKALEGAAEGRAAKVGESLQAIKEVTRLAQRDMRSLIFEWGPAGIGEDLASALTRAAPILTAGSNITFEIDSPGRRLPLTNDVRNHLFGIGREALANIVKHSGASIARVRLKERAGSVIMWIVDDGCGFDPTSRYAGHLGLESMSSRAREIGGDLKIRSRLGRGTLIRVAVPIGIEADSYGD
jgi:signal transduction histidine kinase